MIFQLLIKVVDGSGKKFRLQPILSTNQCFNHSRSQITLIFINNTNLLLKVDSDATGDTRIARISLAIFSNIRYFDQFTLYPSKTLSLSLLGSLIESCKYFPPQLTQACPCSK